MLLIIVGAALALLAFSLLFRSRRRRVPTTARLRSRYLAMLQMPHPAAEATLQRVLRDMQAQYPSRSTRWHLERMISDLQRDRR